MIPNPKLQEPALESLSERELVALAKTGNSEAFKALILPLYGRFLGLAMGIVKNPGVAEELVQDSLTKSFSHLYQFDGQSLFSTWVFKIVTNACLGELKRNRPRAFFYLDQRIKTDSDNLRDDGVSPELTASDDTEGELGKAQITARLLEELRRLPLSYREPLRLKYLQELTTEEAAEVLKMSPSAFKTRLRRARIELHDCMQKHLTRKG